MSAFELTDEMTEARGCQRRKCSGSGFWIKIQERTGVVTGDMEQMRRRQVKQHQETDGTETEAEDVGGHTLQLQLNNPEQQMEPSSRRHVAI